MSRLFVPLLLASTLSLAGQTAGDGVVQAPAVVVSASAPQTPAAGVTQLTADPATAVAAGDWDALTRTAANFHLADGGSDGYGSIFALRGLANTPYFSDPAVTVYFADIPLPSSFTYPDNFFGFSAVSLYRGPEGTGFGRATDGGVVVFSPTTGMNQLTASYGSYNDRRAALSATVAAGGITTTVMAGYGARDGYITNDQIHQRVDDQEHENFFVQSAGSVSPNAKVTVELMGGRDRDGAEPLVPLGGPLYHVSRPQEGVTDLDSWGAAVRLDLALPGNGSLSAVTSVTDWRMNPYTDSLLIGVRLDSLIVQDQKSWNEELHWDSDPRGAIQGHLGLWLSRTDTANYIDRSVFVPIQVPDEVSSFAENSRTGALFGSVDVPLGPQLKLTAGVRGESTERGFIRNEGAPIPGKGYVGSNRYDGVLPKVSLDWTGGDASHASLGVAWGMRPGGYASYTDNPALISFAAERMATVTAGWDRSFGESALGTTRSTPVFDLAIRGFYSRVSNYQIERSFDATGDYYVVDAPRVGLGGGEVEAKWHPASEWIVTLSAGATHAEILRYIDPTTGESATGQAPPYIPKFNGALDVTWRPAGGWFVGAQFSAVGRTDFDELATPLYSQPAYGLLSAKAGYETSRWSVALLGDNLTRRRYYELIIPGINEAAPGAPVRGGVALGLKW
jgi:iron complex outermembrane receptor protein